MTSLPLNALIDPVRHGADHLLQHALLQASVPHFLDLDELRDGCELLLLEFELHDMTVAFIVIPLGKMNSPESPHFPENAPKPSRREDALRLM